MSNGQPHPDPEPARAPRYAFEDFILDTSSGTLLHNGQEIPLRKQAYEMLLILLQRAGELVSKDDLLREIWSEAVVTENSITQCLKEVRHAIGDGELSKIRTVPKRGYIFTLPVRLEGKPPQASSEPLQAVGKPPSSRAAGLAAFAAAALVALVAWWMLENRAGQPPTAEPTPPPENSIAVLPLVNMSADPEMTYLGDGIAEEILNQLAGLPDLLVIARTSSFQFQDQQHDVAEIGEQLNVAHVLEGSFRVDDDRVRVTAQLIDTASQTHLWSRTYDRQLDNIFELQTEVALAVARELQATVAGESENKKSAHVPHPEAYRAVLKGWHHYQYRTVEDLEQALALFKRATELDPDFGLAWARLSTTYLALHDSTQELTLRETLRMGGMAASRAITLEPNLAEVQLRAGFYAYLAGDVDRAEAMLDRAYELEPNNPLIISALAGRMLHDGKVDTAVKFQRRAVDLDPLAGPSRENLAAMLFYAGNFDEMYRELEILSQLNPEMAIASLAYVVWSHLLRGEWQEAEEAIAQMSPSDEMRHQSSAMLAKHYPHSEAASASLQWLQQQNTVLASIQLAEVQAFLGDAEGAFEHLETAIARYEAIPTRYWELRSLRASRNSHFLKSLHEDPRWDEWLRYVAQAES